MKKSTKIVIACILVIMIISATILFINKDRLYNYFYKNGINNIIQSNARNEMLNQLVVTNDYINIRESNTVDSDIVGKVYKDEIYTILDTKEDSNYYWYQIETNSNIKGYIASEKNNSYVSLLLTNDNDSSNDSDGDINNNKNDNIPNNSNNSTNNQSNNNSAQNNSSNNDKYAKAVEEENLRWKKEKETLNEAWKNENKYYTDIINYWKNLANEHGGFFTGSESDYKNQLANLKTIENDYYQEYQIDNSSATYSKYYIAKNKRIDFEKKWETTIEYNKNLKLNNDYQITMKNTIEQKEKEHLKNLDNLKKQYNQ